MIITKAAILFYNGGVLEGHTYSQICYLAKKLGFTGDKIYGFMTSRDIFVDSSNAAYIAFESGQIKTEKDNLEPEDLWPKETSE